MDWLRPASRPSFVSFVRSACWGWRGWRRDRAHCRGKRAPGPGRRGCVIGEEGGVRDVASYTGWGKGVLQLNGEPEGG